MCLFESFSRGWSIELLVDFVGLSLFHFVVYSMRELFTIVPSSFAILFLSSVNIHSDYVIVLLFSVCGVSFVTCLNSYRFCSFLDYIYNYDTLRDFLRDTT